VNNQDLQAGPARVPEYKLDIENRGMTDVSTGPGYLIGVLLDAVVNPYQKSLAQELICAAADFHSRLVFFLGGRIHSGQPNEDRMKFIYRLISAESIDGLILVSNCMMCDEAEKLAYVRLFQPIPIVNIGYELPGIHNIVIDNASGIRRVVRHLAEFHHAKEFAFVGGIENNPDAMERRQAFLQTLRELDIPFDPAMYYPGDFEQDSGVKAVKQLFARRQNIDSVVVANDHMAFGVLEALGRMGKKIPGDVRVTGFDNIPDGSFCIPGLTTAGQPFSRIGRKSIETVVQLIEKQSVPEKILLPVELIVRQSCGCSPQPVLEEIHHPSGGKRGADVRFPAEGTIDRLRPEFGPVLTEEMRQSIHELVQILLAPSKDEDGGNRKFLARWNGIIDEVIVRGHPADFLERVLIEINRSIVSGPRLGLASLKKADVILQNAWYLLLKKLTNLEKSRQYRLEREDIILQYFRTQTASEPSEDEMIDPIRYFIPRLGIQNFFLAEFEPRADPACTSARILLYQCQDPDIVLSKDLFPSRRLIPGGIRSLPTGSNWMVEPISLYDEIGFIVLEMSDRNLIIYSQIMTIVSSYLQEFLLLNQLQNQTGNLQRQSEELTQSVDYLRKIMGAVIQTLSMMVEAKDPYTAGHERRVADLARSIAAEMGLPFEKTEAVRLSSIIHDIGKLYIPSEILNKPGKLLDAEFSLIKLHPKIAFDILKNIEFPWPLAEIIYQHHERCDGSGYPRGLGNHEILLESRIIAVADVVEAMASHRPYRPSLGIDRALKEIADNRGIKFDPEIVDTCLKLFREKGYSLKE
jgi:HD-GYP domain-containing protein (c-di-GMP phosphodiesterase class II)/DNA-binding LacI/PurR family transcriptional regulator